MRLQADVEGLEKGESHSPSIEGKCIRFRSTIRPVCFHHLGKGPLQETRNSKIPLSSRRGICLGKWNYVTVRRKS